MKQMNSDPDEPWPPDKKAGVTKPQGLRWRLLVVPLFAMTVGSAFGLQQFLSAAADEDANKASVPPLPEVIAVADITEQSGCRQGSAVYADPERTDVITQDDDQACPAGSVLHSKPMTQAEAQAAGLPYVMLSGDPAADEAAVNELKDQLGPAGKGSSATDAADAEGHSSLLTCPAQYYTKWFWYTPGAVGGELFVVVHYQRLDNDCGYILVTSSDTGFSTDPNPGEDLYWDDQRYSIFSADMRCKPLHQGGRWYYNPDRYYPEDLWLVDESINDSSLGCSWWGEEYTGSVQLIA